MGPAGGMIIFLMMVNAMPLTIHCKINGLRAELAALGGTWTFAALPARYGPALMTRRAES